VRFTVDSRKKAPPTAEAVAAFLHLIDIEPSIAEAVVRAWFER
jgi:hypothetical protein